MPIKINDLYQEAISSFNIHQGGMMKPVSDFQGWLNTASRETFLDDLKDFEKNSVITDSLRVFLRSVNVRVDSRPGQMYDVALYPKDYEGFASARLRMAGKAACMDPTLPVCEGGSICDTDDEDEKELLRREADENIREYSFDKVTNNRWGALCSHVTQRPSVTAPACTQFDGGFKIAPKNIGVFILDYFRLPVECVYNYKLLNPGTEDEYYEFVSSGSVDLEWSESKRAELLARLKIKYGSKVKSQPMIEAGMRELEKARS